jgi:hypothetical protein
VFRPGLSGLLAQHPEEAQRDYLLYALFTGQPDFMDWLLRNGWASPNEWLGEEGDAYRERVGMQPAPERHRAAWRAFKQTWQGRLRQTIEAALQKQAEAAGW